MNQEGEQTTFSLLFDSLFVVKNSICTRIVRIASLDIHLHTVNISYLDTEPHVFLKKKMCIMFNTRQNRPEYYVLYPLAAAIAKYSKYKFHAWLSFYLSLILGTKSPLPIESGTEPL
jgi:hypothetical protein